jgi:hypothetical protein
MAFPWRSGSAALAGGLAVVLVAACGRLWFDPVSDAAAPAADGGARATLGRFVQCEGPLDQTRRVTVFGANNPSASEVVIPIGDLNRFSPPPEARGQPERFPPGRSVFAVAHGEPVLVWRLLDGTTTSGGSASSCMIIQQNGVTTVALPDGTRVPVP